MNTSDSRVAEKIRPLRRAEYDRLVDLGVFEGEKIELLHGRLVEMSPQGEHHSQAVTRLTKVLVLALGDRAEVRPQFPFAASDVSEPEPDVAVVAPGGYREDHPGTAYLVIEVAVSSLDRDRRVKAPMYAAAGVPEYWIVNLQAGEVEVHRGPGPEGYSSVTRHGRDAVLVVPGFEDVRVVLGEILPPA